MSQHEPLDGLAPLPDEALTGGGVDAPLAGEDGLPDGVELTGVVDEEVTRLRAERDDYLDALRRQQAEFENSKKRMMREQTNILERAAEGLAEKLLPVLDACDLALAHGADGVEPVFAALLGTLEKEGLERVDPLNQPFDPNEHDAVLHEAGAEGEGPVVTDVLRFGYRWKGRVLRPAMVKVRG